MTSDPPYGDMRKRLEFSERRRLHLTRSLSRKSTEEDGLLWSVADLMTLLLIFFVVFHGNGAPGEDREPSLAPTAALASAPLPQQPPACPPQAQPEPEPPPAVAMTDGTDIYPAEISPWVDRLETEVARLLEDRSDQAFSVRWEARRPVIVLGEQITFNEGTAELLTDFLPVLTTVVQFLNEQATYGIQVAGHTDTTPIHNSIFPSNWELSAARAVNVARFLIHRGVSPERLSIQGFAEFHPIEPNTTARQRQINRRVEITLLGPEA